MHEPSLQRINFQTLHLHFLSFGGAGVAPGRSLRFEPSSIMNRSSRLATRTKSTCTELTCAVRVLLTDPTILTQPTFEPKKTCWTETSFWTETNSGMSRLIFRIEWLIFRNELTFWTGWPSGLSQLFRPGEPALSSMRIRRVDGRHSTAVAAARCADRACEAGQAESDLSGTASTKRLSPLGEQPRHLRRFA